MSAHVLATGEDAADFLQSQFSNDLRPFSPGQCTYGLWLDVKGKIVADSWVFCEGGERFHIYSEHSDAALIQEKLESHIVADEVELETGQPVSALAVVGTTLEGLGDLSGVECVIPGRRSSRPSHELIFKDASARQAWLDQADMNLVSSDWILAERMQAGISQLHSEVLPGDLPEEGGLLEDAVSLTKGCFLGQEVIARMHNLGRPQRGLFILDGPGPLPGALSPVENSDGKTLGELRTSIPVAGAWQGVAMLKTRFVESGMQLMLSGQTVRVDKTYG